MAKQEPRLAFKVDNKLTEQGGKMGVELKFGKLADFEPDNVARQVAPLNQLLELRTKLSNLRSSLYGNHKLEALLHEAIEKTESARRGSGSPGRLSSLRKRTQIGGLTDARGTTTAAVWRGQNGTDARIRFA